MNARYWQEVSWKPYGSLLDQDTSKESSTRQMQHPEWGTPPGTSDEKNKPQNKRKTMLTKHYGRYRRASKDALAGFYQISPSNIVIIINSTATKMIDLNMTKQYVTLHYDKDKGLVALKFHPEREEGALKVTTGMKRNTTIAATSFVKDNDIQVTRNKFPVFQHKENGETYYAFVLENGK